VPGWGKTPPPPEEPRKQKLAPKWWDQRLAPTKEAVTGSFKMGPRGVLPDLLSVQFSQLRYGVATPPPVKVGFKYEQANLFGYVPTAEMIKRGAASEKKPRPLRELLPKGFKGGKI
jgi:hypothetical protein